MRHFAKTGEPLRLRVGSAASRNPNELSHGSQTSLSQPQVVGYKDDFLDEEVGWLKTFFEDCFDGWCPASFGLPVRGNRQAVPHSNRVNAESDPGPAKVLRRHTKVGPNELEVGQRNSRIGRVIAKVGRKDPGARRFCIEVGRAYAEVGPLNTEFGR